MIYCRIGHSQKHFVVKGQIVKKGDLVATCGTGNGQYSAHVHCDFPKKEIWWNSYVFGMTKAQVKTLYADPKPYRNTMFPTYDHMGWGYLELATYGAKTCYHPGEDWNGKGAGNSDLGLPIFSPFDGKVILDYDDDKSLNGGWGKLIVIKEIEPVPEKKPEVVSNVVEEVKTPEKSISEPTVPSEIQQVISEKSPEPTVIPKILEIIKNLIINLINKWKN